MNPQIAKKITARIKKEHITPTPKWHFVFKNWVFWILFGISVILGSLAFSVVIFEFSESEIELFGQLSFFDLLINYLPIFWFVFLTGFIALAFYGARHTKKGYKFSPLLILSTSVAISAILGILIFAFDIAEKTEDVFAKNLSFYKGLHERKQEIWMKAEKGLLGGEIISIDQENKIIILQDFDGKRWKIDFSKVSKIPPFLLQPGAKIRIMGKAIDNDNFHAKVIKPWIGMKERKIMPMHNENLTPKSLPPRLHNEKMQQIIEDSHL